MRELKFRGLADNGKMYYGNLTILTRPYNDTKPGYYISNKSGCPFAYDVNKETVGQYTRQNDIKEKEIYEGDIVALPWINKKRAIAQVIFDEKYGEYICHWIGTNTKWRLYGSDSNENLEIIGNIYQNKELLNERD